MPVSKASVPAQTPQQATRKPTGFTVILIGVAIAVAIIFLMNLFGGKGGPQPPSGVRVGAQLSIVGSSCPAMRTKDLCQELNRTIRAGDVRGATRDLLSRGGRFLEPGTPVMVKDVAVFAGCAEVTLQSNGADMGERWFVALNCLPK